MGLPRLDANSLSCVADFCSLRDCCVLRHRISKCTSKQLASADESEVFARARVLRRVARSAATALGGLGSRMSGLDIHLLLGVL